MLQDLISCFILVRKYLLSKNHTKPVKFFCHIFIIIIIYSRKLILLITRFDWSDCLRSECYIRAAAVIVDDDNFACKGKGNDEDKKLQNCFRPSYSLSDLTWVGLFKNQMALLIWDLGEQFTKLLKANLQNFCNFKMCLPSNVS